MTVDGGVTMMDARHDVPPEPALERTYFMGCATHYASIGRRATARADMLPPAPDRHILGQTSQFWGRIGSCPHARSDRTVGNALRDRTVVVVGRGSGIARAVALLARSEGARVVVAGRDKPKLESAYAGRDIAAEVVDLTDDESIAALAARVGAVDHVVSTASARSRGKLADLDRHQLRLSFDTKVIGPTMLAKHFAPQMKAGGSLVLFSGVHAFKHNVGYLGVGITNGAVDFLARWLAVELAPVRVNAISPGVIDSGAWDAFGDEGKRDYFNRIADGNPVGRIGTTDDIAGAVLFAMTNTFMTGVTLKVDGGEPLT
ncbi:SDR family oxidoreductase [Mycobacterium sp. E2699]|uniref:SDR family oxidoreductase n=1 Tax=Mycobacterium sp. E2699 TaxID=1834137 RepID=UPI001E3E9048|nr:SDR family oxidoreductase [Mycobacterium sp. E2699]